MSKFIYKDIGRGRFYNGDCLEVMKEIPDNTIDMILCDLPYGTTQNKWDSIIPFDKLWEQYWRIVKINSAIVLTSAQPFTSKLIMSDIDNFKYTWIWKKGLPTGHLNANIQPLRETEDICVFYKKQCIYKPQNILPTHRVRKGSEKSNRGNYHPHSKDSLQTITNYPTTILNFKSDKGFHTTQKPVALFEYLIKTYTDENSLVLDNCSGSGTTSAACEKSKRNWICIEKDEIYYKKSIERIENFTHHGIF